MLLEFPLILDYRIYKLKNQIGFSFKHNGPLDMRMSKSGLKAEDFLKNVDEKTLADILFELGDERHSRKIAKLNI